MIYCLSSLHILIIFVSNYLVQLPLQFAGVHTTWGAFSFPFVYLLTDLTVRILGKHKARKVIFLSMLPALVLSYIIGSLFHQGHWQSFAALTSLDVFVLRIALASFSAYLVGQLLDITVFNQLRRSVYWWLAPTASTFFGNLADSLVFFSVAFYASSDPFMANYWPEIATVDYGVKLFFSLIVFLPLYGMLLTFLLKNKAIKNHTSIPPA